jgi:tetratricopeptide (TPR) repeat protein
MLPMANFFEQKNRNVVPNFRRFSETIELGELSHAWKEGRKSTKFTINRNIIEWEKEKSVGAASDLLSSAIVTGITNIEEVNRAAEFILSNKLLITPTQRDIANRVLEKNHNNLAEVKNHRILNYLSDHARLSLYDRIRELKENTIRFNSDPILFTELARLYSILGQKEKAKRNMIIAIGLAPDNRYVLRSFVRLFAHYGEVEFAYYFLKKRDITKSDPWLLSADIALATILERESKLIKSGFELLRSNKFSDFSTAELRSGLGTIELLNGSRKKSRDLLKAALSDPNDNALAQVEWVLTQERIFELDVTKFNVKRNYEALALESFNKYEWKEALEHSENWFMDMPFAKRPIMLGSHISSVILDDQKTAESFCRAGLVAHPGDIMLMNNLAYSLALDNRADEALTLIQNISSSHSNEISSQVCLIATKGLIHFRRSNYDLGRLLYLEAIDLAAKIPNPSYIQLALLNYAREEILCNSEYIEPIVNKVSKLKINPKIPGLKILFDRIISLYEKKKESNA